MPTLLWHHALNPGHVHPIINSNKWNIEQKKCENENRRNSE